MAILVLAESCFAAVWLGAKTTLETLAIRVMDAAKWIFGVPDFYRSRSPIAN